MLVLQYLAKMLQVKAKTLPQSPFVLIVVHI
jgi:hypothetical protein